MRRVEQRERTVFAGLGHRVVAQVRGEEGLDACGAHVVEEAVAGAAADRHGAHQHVRVARDADALRRGGQPLGGELGELTHGQRMVQLADPAEAAAAVGVRGVGDEGPYDPQVQGAREGIRYAGVGAVGVGVRDVQRDVILDQGVHDAALEVGGRHRRRTAQIQRVVGDQQVGTELHGLVGDLLDRVDGEQHPGDLRVRFAAHGADRVPSLGQLGGPESVERGGDFRQTGHEGKASSSSPPSRRRSRRPGSSGAHHDSSRLIRGWSRLLSG
ncbi:hypothetical protein STSP_37870 [Streptomyces jeddahensis]|uniref:Uncharacterized protein n=1 Tax=Streptomyces jeddahensis TaxID=1716141 RepID=A0A177HPT1_9ACTN|nr:hypothetical protein STSP_37870 [Streptomyces jeddahensis]